MTLATHADDVVVPFGGTLTFRRFRAVQKAMRPRWSHPLMTVAFVVLLLSLWNDGVVWYGPGMLAMLAINVFLAGAAWLAIQAATRFTYRRHWRRMTDLHGALSGSVGAGGIDWNTKVVDSRYRWDRIAKVREADDMVLLYFAPRCALYFPREFFADEASWNAFRSAVRTYAKRA